MDYAEAKRLTEERMADPRPGDVFHEMHTFMVKVISREGDWVISQDRRGIGWGAPRLDTTAEFRARFAYGSIPGYWVLYDHSDGRLDEVPADATARARWMVDLVEERKGRVTPTSMGGASP